MFEHLIDKLVPIIAPERQAALAAFTKETVRAAATIDSVRDVWGTTVERLARISAKTLQPRLVPAASEAVSRIVRDALELRSLFDRDTPIDLHDVVRGARAAKTDAEFSAALHLVRREVERYTSKAALVKRLAEQIQRDLTALDAQGDAMWSSEFVPTPQPAGGYISA